MEILIVAKSRILYRSGPAFAGAILFGCQVGELEGPPPKYSPQDTAIVFVPPKDTTSTDSVVDIVPVVTGSPGMLYPRLFPGDKWVFSQKGDGYAGAIVSLEIVGDSVYGDDSVYVETISVEVPIFFSPYGDTVLNYVQSGRLYLRKADQETVHDTVTTEADIHYFGDSVSSAYRMEAGSVSTFAGKLPDGLKAGAAWTLTANRRATSTWGWDGLVYGTRDTTWTDTADYSVRGSAPIKVKAGTFPVLQIDWSTRGSESPTVGWYAPAAKTLIREIDGNPASADTTEMTSFSVE
jgi:hypothetical protein